MNDDYSNSAEDNQTWVRDMVSKKKIQIDRRQLIMKLPDGVVHALFNKYIEREFPDART